MRRHDQPVDLLVAIIGKREDRPIPSRLARAHFDAPDDAVVARRGRYLHAVAVGMLELDRVGQVDCAGVGADIDGFDGLRRRHANERREGERQKRAAQPAKRRGAQSFGAERVGAQIGGAQKCQETPPRPAVGAVCAILIDPGKEYLPGFAPNSRRPDFLAPQTSHGRARPRPFLVSLDRLQGKAFPVYFQRVRPSLPVWLPGLGEAGPRPRDEPPVV